MDNTLGDDLVVEILAAETATLQNVYAPLPFKVHFIFCIIATLLYITQFVRKGSYHYLTLLAAIDLTIVTQFCTKSFFIGMLFGAEVVLLAATAFLSHRFTKANEEKKKAAAEKADDPVKEDEE